MFNISESIIIMASNNIQMPMFAPASQHGGSGGVGDGGGGGGGWNEVDHFDVDILAEYLLGDGSLPSTGGGVTFDFMYVCVPVGRCCCCCGFTTVFSFLSSFRAFAVFMSRIPNALFVFVRLAT